MTPSTEQQPADKATLYCPECGHESCINGDWMIRVLADSTTYACPKCETTIESRRNRHALTEGSDGAFHFASDD